MKILNKLIESIGTIWYHGSPDGREIEAGGFENNEDQVLILKDVESYKNFQSEMNELIKNDRAEYDNRSSEFQTYKEVFKYTKPIFLTDDYSTADSYTNPHRAFDFQRAEPIVFKCSVNDGKLLTIDAGGDKFRHIKRNTLIRGLSRVGIDEIESSLVIDKFVFNQRDKDNIKTDTIGAISQYFGFDTVDIHNVIDSYDNGKIKSTVKMVFNADNITIENVKHKD